jgi:hypothetical protein
MKDTQNTVFATIVLLLTKCRFKKLLSGVAEVPFMEIDKFNFITIHKPYYEFCLNRDIFAIRCGNTFGKISRFNYNAPFLMAALLRWAKFGTLHTVC